MILQALTQYYERKSQMGKGEIPVFGFETKVIPVIIEINQEGHLVQIRVNDKNTPSAQYVVPQSVKRASGIVANLFWDNAEYALGLNTKGNSERVIEQHVAFIERIQQLSIPAIEDDGVQAVLKFFSTFDPVTLKNHPHWEILQSNPNISFQLQGDDRLICQRKAVIDSLTYVTAEKDTSICLVTGENDEPERLHSAIKGVWGAQSSGANIVSFNLEAFNSFAKSQGFNAPVGKKASFAYTTALNYLLRKGSEQRIQVGDASTVFWSDKTNEFETIFSTIFGSTPKIIKDDPDRYAEAVKAVFKAPYYGKLSEDERETQFFVLGLAPNAARIAIRFWIRGTVSAFSERIKQHFNYLEMIHGNNDLEYLPLFILLVHVAVQGKSDNIPPNVGGEVMRSILEGRPYPFTLFSAAIRRSKSEKNVTYPRAAIIKAYLNRVQNEEEIKVSLDKENTNVAYRLGRLFATLEKIQEEASPGLNATMRDRYYSAASSNPVSVFPTLLKLKNHHLSKLDNPGRKTNFEKSLGEIMNAISPDLPASLSIQDQGRFAVGYYHQRQDFFTKKTETKPGEEV
jgi:CRISPR-associated protein Csd1